MGRVRLIGVSDRTAENFHDHQILLGKTFEILNFVTGSRPMTTPPTILLLKMLTRSMQHQNYDKRLPQQVVGEELPCQRAQN